MKISNRIFRRKRLKESLKIEQQELKLILDSAPIMIFYKDREGRFLRVNKALTERFNLPEEEVIGKTVFDLNPVRIAQGMTIADREVLKSGLPMFNIIEEYVSASGIRWVQTDKIPIYGENGLVIGLVGFAQDITERQQAKEALRESEERFRSLVENIDLGINLIGSDYRIKMINPSMERVFRKPASEFIGKKCFRELEKRETVCPHCPGKIAMATGRKAEVETRGVRDDGSGIPVRVQAFPYFDARGEITGFIEVGEDITQRMEAEKELKQAHAALAEEAIRRRLLVEQSRDGIVILDQNGKVYEANQRYAEMLGYSAEEVRELYVWDWDAQWTREELLEMVRHVDATGDHFETRHRRKDGTFLEVEISTNGAVLGGQKLVFCVCRDISERKAAERALKESEEKYRLVFEKAPLGIVHYDRTSTITDSNEMFAEIIGAPKGKFIGFHMIRQLRDDKMRQAVVASLKGEVGYYEGDYVSVTAGKLTPVRAIYQPLFSLDGVIAGGVGIFEDITERQKAEAERLHFSKLESLATLAGGIVHDFNNILTAIMGNISLAKLDQYDGQRLTDAENACLRAKALALQLLTFAKGGAPIKELISVARLLTETGSFACRGANVRCEFSLPDNLWAVNADPSQLGQVSHNLVINAIQAMPTGGVITVQGENLVVEAGSDLPLDPGKYVKISIQDQGLGIPAEYLPRIFDPYFTTKQMGSGLGLATAYSIIKAHQGHIAVESTLGKGTIFQVYLPAAEQKIIEQTKVDKELIKGDAKILVMDDEEMVQEIIGKMLGHLGYQAIFAGDGEEAIELFTRAQQSGTAFDAVILDLTVPGGMGGKAAMEKLRQIDPQVNAIVSSGYSDDPVMAEFARYGFSGVIAKPYRITELSKVLNKVLRTGKRGDFHKG
jgi:PAS domain S-box-containing protein